MVLDSVNTIAHRLDTAKEEGRLQVEEEIIARLLEREGAVSEAAALAMAEGARRLLGADVAVAVTGIAGPSGATDDKPVGLTYVALAGPESRTWHRPSS